jgi:hypothetical protein
MTMNDLDNIKALVSFGKLGFSLLASRMISVLTLLGLLALSGYVAYVPSWQGAICVAVIALFVFQPALKAEGKREEPKGE